MRRSSPRTVGWPAVLLVGSVMLVLVLVPPERRSACCLLTAFSSVTSNAGNSFSAAASFLSYPQTVVADHPSVYYRGDDADGSPNAADSSGNGTTGGYLSVVNTFQVPGGPAGAGDTAVYFSGDSTTANGPSMTVPDVFTYEIWFRTTSTAGGRILSFGSASSGYSSTVDRYVALTGGGALSMTVASTTVTSTVVGLNDGTWHLVGATLGPAGMHLYADGTEVAAAAGTTSGTALTGYFRLGGDVSYITATLDEAVLYLKQLSAARMSAHYAAGANAASLAAYTATLNADTPWAIYHLNDAPDTAYKALLFQTRLADATASNHRGWYSYVRPRGVFGGRSGALVGADASSTAVHFTGSGIGYYPTKVTNPTTFTLELWFRTTSTTGGDLISFGDSMTGDSAVYDRIWKMLDDGTVTFGIYTGGTIVSVTSTGAYNDGAWHYGALTVSPADGMTLYLDGVAVAANAAPGAPQNYAGYWRWAGGKKWTTPPTSEYFLGDLDEVAIYPSRLTAQQVARHFWTNS
jgi:hypothetical protein